MRAIWHLLRDHRIDAVHAIDPTLFDQLVRLQRRLDATEPYHVVCGYRSPETNAFLRRQHHGIPGPAISRLARRTRSALVCVRVP
jgi:uncharacterized protein YcbK (DUF882 family)